MRLVTVNSVLSVGAQGGAIFTATDENGSAHRIIAPWNVMPRAPIPGETWSVEGVQRRHPDYGVQVDVQRASLQRPSGRLVIPMIAKSSVFPGIGEAKARQLWETFGEDLYAVLDKGHPGPFLDLLGERLSETLVAGWEVVSTEAAVYAWLDRHGAPLWLARKLIAIYGYEVVAKLEENPYRLLAFTNWKTADTLARSMGIPPEDERRLVAAADAMVYKRLQSAHTWCESVAFKTGLRKLLNCPDETARKAVNLALAESSIVEAGEGVQGIGPASMERYIASRIHAMLAREFEADQLSIRMKPEKGFLQPFFVRYAERHGINLNAAQKDAVTMALTEPVGLICGGAGVGKTTVLRAIVEAADPLGVQVYMMALSGRAARRMTEATGRDAMTIASFITAVDAERIDLSGEPTIAIDEASMLDIPIMYRLLRRLEPGCKLLLLGDPGQLPPIGFGIVFHALVESPAIPQVELTEIHRQAAHTGIPQISRAVRGGGIPELFEYNAEGVGVSFVECPNTQIPDVLMDVVHELGGVGASQVISPLKSGAVGTCSINTLFQNLLAIGRERYYGFSVGEPVIWLVNNYELGLMNGSLGVVKAIEPEGLRVVWDEGEKVIAEEDVADNMDLAYAITVHKSQGSQWRRVVVPVFESRLLDRALIYTAITRAQEQVVLVGDRNAFEKAVREPSSASRRETAMQMHLERCRYPKPTLSNKKGVEEPSWRTSHPSLTPDSLQ